MEKEPNQNQIKIQEKGEFIVYFDEKDKQGSKEQGYTLQSKKKLIYPKNENRDKAKELILKFKSIDPENKLVTYEYEENELD